ncbi:hydroxysteroid 11-beta-dehydrogenase 1-like protein isoform X1 [Hylobates moloch]|uniref:hydroxysteroid 11-beta-dehydrogenase 1-like protein isoform X1 n=3 Tax=Hylobates moloch TaxID=81572 RepID=UPI00136247FC|nr:hydroxysteroid 11-beta-dehydrogenase 1-like protein isoform X1 [Hylobates moloch]
MDPRRWHHQTPTKHGWLWARPVLATSVPCPSAGPQRTMKVLLLTGLGALFFAYYWDDNFDPASLQGARVLLTGANAGVGEELAYHYARLGSHLVLTAHTEALLQKQVRWRGERCCRGEAHGQLWPPPGGRELPEAGRPQGLLHRGGHGLPRGARERGAVCAGQAGRAGLPRVEPHRRRPSRHASPQPPGDALAHAGKLFELRATDVAGAAQPDRQQRLPRGGVLAARPRAHVVLHSLLGGQVRAGRLLRLPAAGAGRAGRERGHHHVRPGPPRSRLRRRGSQGSHEGQGGPGAQGSPGRDPRRRHARGWRLLPVAFPPVVLAPALAAAPAGLVYPPGAQRHGCGCSLSTRGCPSTSQTTAFLSPIVPGARTLTETPLRGWPQPKMKSSRQKSKTKKNDGHLEPITASEVQMRKLRLREVTPPLSHPWTPLHLLPVPLSP